MSGSKDLGFGEVRDYRISDHRIRITGFSPLRILILASALVALIILAIMK